MHELALSRAIVDAVARHAEGRPVSGVRMRIGSLRQVVPDSLAFYFEIVSRDTVCAGADIDYELVPALLACPRCEERWDPLAPRQPSFRCPSCGCGGDVIGGDEFEIESITVEEPDRLREAKEESCTAPR